MIVFLNLYNHKGKGTKFILQFLMEYKYDILIHPVNSLLCF